MEIRIKIESVDYGSIAVKAMPLLIKKADNLSGAVGKLLSSLSYIPEDLIRQLFDSLPDENKNEIISLLAEERQGQLVDIINEQLRKNEIGLTVTSIFVSSDAQIRLMIGEIDYNGIVARLLPLVRGKINVSGTKGQLISMLLNAKPSQIGAILSFVPKETKDMTAALLLNNNKDRIINAVSEMAKKHGIEISVGDLTVEA